MERKENEPLLKRIPEETEKGRTYVAFVFLLAYALYTIGWTISFYALNEWIQHFEQSLIFPNGSLSTSSACEDINRTDYDQDLYKRVESETAKWQMLASLCASIPSLISTSVLPAYSDRFGRKFIIIGGFTGVLIKMCVSTISIYYNWHPLYIVIASVIQGCTGGLYSVQSGCYSYIADLTNTGKWRTIGLNFLDGFTLICMTLPGLGVGYFIKYTGYFIPIATSFGMSAVACLLFACGVPESYPKHMRLQSRSVLSVLKGTFSFYISNTFKKRRSAYLLLLTAFVLENLTSGPRASLEMLYQLGRPFCWSADKIGIFSFARHFAQGLAGMFIVKPLKYCFSDLNIAIISMVTGCGSFVLEGLARTNLMLYLVPALATFSYLCESMIKSMMSIITPRDKQGSLFSSIALTSVVCDIASSFLFNTIYAETVSFNSGFVFLLEAGICLLTVAILLVFSRNEAYKEEPRRLVNTTETDSGST